MQMSVYNYSIEPFIANLGHRLWGSQSMQGLAPGIRNLLPFLIEMLSRALTAASPIKDDPDSQ